MFNKYLLLCAIIIGGMLYAPKSKAQCIDSVSAFTFGEKISYDTYYNWGFIWAKVGLAFFEVDSATYLNKEVFYFKSFGTSLKKHDWFFKVRDSYASYADIETLNPYMFIRKTSEGGYDVKNKYLFDNARKKIFSFTENSDKPYVEDTLDYPPCTFDVLTAVYYARNIDFSHCEIGDTIPLSMIIDNEVFNLHTRYLGKEIIEIKKGETYRCTKFSALLVEGTIFSGGEDLTVWVTDDENKIPVMVDAKILVGSVKAILTDMENLKYPVSSRVEKRD